ncbi:MAG: hypothetical protein R3Y29_05870 [bacterium]
MKMTIRQGVFETNSSSTHAVTITTLETYNRWLSDELFIRLKGGADYEFVEKEEILEKFRKMYDEKNQEFDENDFYDFVEDKLCDLELQSLETYKCCDGEHGIPFVHHFTSPNGDEMVVFGEGPQDY